MGGKVFPECKPFHVDSVYPTVSLVERLLNVNTHIVGSCYNYDPHREYGDLDLMVDLDLILLNTNSKTAKEAKQKLVEQLKDFGIESTYIGNNVHICIGNKQVDVMLIKNAEKISKFHQYPPSKYKGRNVHILMSYIAKQYNMFWSPFNGLYNRTDGKKGDFITIDVSEVCKHLKLSSFGNVEQLSSQIPNAVLEQAKTDPNW